MDNKLYQLILLRAVGLADSDPRRDDMYSDIHQQLENDEAFLAEKQMDLDSGLEVTSLPSIIDREAYLDTQSILIEDHWQTAKEAIISELEEMEFDRDRI